MDESTNETRTKMWRWRNVTCPESEPDAEMRTIEAFEATLNDVPPLVERIRALISRVDPLSHYKAFENLDFLLDAIGDLDYPGSPAVDVLWRYGDIDESRRERAKGYVDAMNAWLAGMDPATAKDEQPENAARVAQVYEALGAMDDRKRWLAMCLRKTLKELAYTPWDFINEYEDAAFVRAVYESILGRPPSPDDLVFRVEELEGGKTREAFLTEIIRADEHRRMHLHDVATRLKHRGHAQG
jgi:hypothetical protein